MNSTTKEENLDGDRIPVCRQKESRGGALFGSGPLGESLKGESPCHPNPDSACPAGAEIQGNVSAKSIEMKTKGEIELSPEWKSVYDFGEGITSTPRVNIERIDLTRSPGGGAKVPRVIEVEKVNPEVTEYLTRKRTRMQARSREETTTNASEEGE